MTRPNGSGGPPGSTIIRLLAHLVPATHRAEWCDEWLAELTCSSLPAARRRLRALGAVTDAFWLWRHHGEPYALEPTMLAHDVRFALRTLRRRPAFTAIVVTTLALCIGATSAVFSIVEAVLLRGLPYNDLNRLAAVWSNNPKEQNDHYQLSIGDYFDLRARNRSFSELAGYFPIWNATYTAPDVADRIEVGAVSANFLRTLGVRPELGRDFVDGEDRRDARQAVILSHEFWSRVFHDDPAAVERTIILDGQPYVVAGVTSATFTFPQNKVDVIAPLAMLGSYIDRRGVHMLSVVGRLAPGVSIERARTEMTTLAHQLEQEHPKENAGLGATVRPLRDDLLGDVRRPILVLFGAVCAVLLIGCANVASLMLTRSVSRRHELAVRVAIGAEPSALARQMLVESAVIAAAAGVLGIGIAFGATHVAGNLLPASIARMGAVHIDGLVLAFTSALCVIVAIGCGVTPALRGARGAVRGDLRKSGRGASHGMDIRRFHATLVVAELALALALVACAGLLVNSFARIVAVDPGFRTDHLVRAKISLPSLSYPGAARRDEFMESLVQRVAAFPGVVSVGLVSRFPLTSNHLTTNVLAEGSAYRDGDQLPTAEYRMANAGYFATMGIPVLAGRAFELHDNAERGAAHVMVVNRTAAVQLLGGPNAVGKRVRLGGAEGPSFTVVGVVGDIRDATLRQPPPPQVYISTRQGGASDVSIVVRYNGSVEQVVKGMRSIVGSLDPSLPVFSIQTIEEIMRGASVSDRFVTTLLSLFAILAVVLAALGTYGVVAFGVAERTREIGVRMALGAQASEVALMVVREGITLFIVALPLALAATWWASRALRGLLFGVGALDPATLSAAVLALGAVAVLAALIPARRAAHVDPMIAMRGTG